MLVHCDWCGRLRDPEKVRGYSLFYYTWYKSSLPTGEYKLCSSCWWNFPLELGHLHNACIFNESYDIANKILEQFILGDLDGT
jgi:hypothetical protein